MFKPLYCYVLVNALEMSLVHPFLFFPLWALNEITFERLRTTPTD